MSNITSILTGILDSKRVGVQEQQGFIFTNQDGDSYIPSSDSWYEVTGSDSVGQGSPDPDGSDINDVGYQIAGINLQYTNEYTYSTDSWAAMTDIPSPPRYAHAVTTPIKDSLYSFSGFNSGTRLSDNDEYTPDSWVSRTNVTSPDRTEPTANSENNKAYLVGGYDGGSRLSDNDEYTPPVTDSWTARTGRPLAASAPASFHLNSKIYVTGGYNGAAGQLDNDELTAPSTWVSRTDMPAPARFRHRGANLQSKGYCTGGSGGLTDHDEYTFDSWTSRTESADFAFKLTESFYYASLGPT